MIFLADHDRRGHGRSSRHWQGNDMDHDTDGLATVTQALDLREVGRYIGRHGTPRAKKAVLIGAISRARSCGPGRGQRR